jgi:16S rRNA (guanine527-N7)-methyltransferase
VTVATLESLQAVTGSVSRETFERLVVFEQTFLKWAQRINLSADSTLDDVWNRHILDSAQLFPLAPHARRWLDLGSGGGFPGLVVAFLLADRSDAHIDLVEANRKKAGFLQAIVGQFGLPARVHARRIDDLYTTLELPEIVIARALAQLPPLLELTAPWLTKGSTGLFHKGRDYRQEIEDSAQLWSFDLLERRSKTNPHGVILEISNLRSKGPDGL